MKIRTFNPFSGEVLGEVECDGDEDIKKKLERLKKSKYYESPLEERANLLRKLVQIIFEEFEEIAQLITREQGKPIVESKSVELLGTMESILYLSDNIKTFLRNMEMNHRVPFFSHKKGFFTFEPYGVALVISPWNYPFAIPVIEIATALAGGNTVLFKPSTVTPLTGKKIEEIFKRAGFPVELVMVRGRDVEKIIPMVDLVLFTGSTETGMRIGEICGRSMVKTVLELGGKDPMIVLPDASLERAVNGAIWGSLVNAGQTCAAIERVYVHESLYRDFLDLILNRVEEIETGDPLNPDTELGPLVAEFQVETVDFHVKEALSMGAELLSGGRGDGLFYLPTVLVKVDHGMKVMKEETFGPVIPIMPFSTEEEALFLANDTHYGLTASVWTEDMEKALHMAERLKAATVTINDHAYSFGEPAALWGGMKKSGKGRSHGRFGLMDVVQVKFISADMCKRDRELWWYPYSDELNRTISHGVEFMFNESISRRVKAMIKNIDIAGKIEMKDIISSLRRLLRGP